MNKKFLFFLMVIVFLAAGLTASENPEAVSPGNELKASIVHEVCPTFSWTQISGAASYQVAVFEMTEAFAGLSYYENQAAFGYPVLVKKIPGSATSWTPSLEQALQNGGRYVWFVMAQDAYGTGTWSVGKKFAVRASLGLTEIREKIKEQLEAKGVKGDLIDEAFKDIQPQDMPPKEGGELTGKIQEERDDAVQTKIEAQGSQEIRGKENLTAQRTSDFTAGTLGSENDGNNNVYYGSGAGSSLGSTAYYNAFFGYNAGNNTDTGDRNVFVGSYAGQSNTSGVYNTFMGYYAGYANTSGSHNTFLGYNAGNNNTTTGNNTFIGYNVARNNTTGSPNTFIGCKAGYSNTTGSLNTFVGDNAGYSNTTTNGNTFMGSDSGYSNATGYYNTFMGCDSGFSNTTGYHNTFIGYIAGQSNTSGNDNVFIGNNAGDSNTTGGENIFIGVNAGQSNTTGDYNTYVGRRSGYSNDTGSSNVFLGYRAGYNETGSSKLYIDSSDTSSPLIYGEFDNELVTINGTLNVTYSNINVDTASKRARFKLQADGDGTNTDDFFNFTMRNDKGDVTLSVWDDSASGWLPMLSYEYLNSKVDFKNNDIVTTGTISSGGGAYTSGGAWIEASSRDYKENIMELGQSESLQALESLNPVRYNYKNKKDEEFLGFIAEDVPDLVAMNSRKGMRAMDIVAVLTKVAQEQQRVNKEQEEMLEEQNELIIKLIERIKKLEEKKDF